jgi:hypothetical protein
LIIDAHSIEVVSSSAASATQIANAKKSDIDCAFEKEVFSRFAANMLPACEPLEGSRERNAREECAR